MTETSGKPTKADVEFPPYDLGGRIKLLRESRKLSQAELARLASISQSTIAQIETGRTADPTYMTLKKVADVLDVDIAVLFASPDVHVFDMRRLKEKYQHVDHLSPYMFMALSKVVQYAKDIEFIR